MNEAAVPDWRGLVNLGKLRAWMDEAGLAGGDIKNPTLLTGGTQNILIRFSRGGRPYVLRRPPAHSIANGSETMRREAKILRALAGTDVPHARLIAVCPDEKVLGAAFYLMEPVVGFNATVEMPALHTGDPAIRRAMGFALVGGILALGRVDPFAAGLASLGRLDNYLARQTSRWRYQYDGYAVYDGWPPDSLSGIDEIASWLDAHCPASFTPGILHGDYHIANVMFRRDGPGLAAIVDWELASVGDPLIDLGWLLATWPEPGQEKQAISVSPWNGFPTKKELLDHYVASSDRDTSALLWYKVLACYKLGILLEGSQARAIAGKAPQEVGQKLHDQAVALFRQARQTINSGEI